MNFPYISQIQVKSCFTYSDFNIPAERLNEFKHIILTGKNGSGKTTILNRIAGLINSVKVDGKTREESIRHYKSLINNNLAHAAVKQWTERLTELDDVQINYLSESSEKEFHKSNDYVFSFFKAHRKVQLQQVSTVTTENQFLEELKKNGPDRFAGLFKQYLVNKKVYEAFDYMSSKKDNVSQNKLFFDDLENTLKNIFGDKGLILEFHQESFEFFINFSDGRKITFNQLSEGFSAFISILMDLLLRVDLIRKNKLDFTYNPQGIVLIDEPETHFHIEMQYEILPLLTKLFPKIQFIIATHSPAIISSLSDSFVMDLSSKKEIFGWQVGSSFSELMIKHFGLENEFSPIADQIILDVNVAVQNNNISLLQKIIVKNEKFLTPSLKFEIENQILAIESRKV